MFNVIGKTKIFYCRLSHTETSFDQKYVRKITEEQNNSILLYLNIGKKIQAKKQAKSTHISTTSLINSNKQKTNEKIENKRK